MGCRHLRRFVLVLSVAVVAGLAPVANAEIQLHDEIRVLMFGDFRFRAESDWSSQRSDGTERDDRDRARIRVRLGFKWEPIEQLQLGIRGRTGNTNSQQSPHVTVIQSGDNGDEDVLIDRAWVKLSFDKGNVWLGRNGHPFWRQDELQFDDDIWLDGVGFGLRFSGGDNQHQVNGAWAAVPEGEASLDWDEQGSLYGLQYVFQRDLGDGQAFTAALSGIGVEDDSDFANPVLLDVDYMLWALNLQGKLMAGDWPVTLGLDVFHNSDAPPKGTFNRDERDGWSALVRFGSLKSKGDWLLGYQHAHVEKFAVVPFLAQDDWLRWGSATQTRSSNWEGHEFRVGYALGKRMNLLLRGYVVDGIERESASATDEEDGNRIRLDFHWHF